MSQNNHPNSQGDLPEWPDPMKECDQQQPQNRRTAFEEWIELRDKIRANAIRLRISPLDSPTK